MKILYIFYQYPLYKNGSYFHEFINALCKKLKEVSLIAYYYPKTKFKKPNNLNMFWLKKFNLGFLDELLFMVSALVKVITVKEFKNIDLINVIGPRGILAGWYLKKRHHIPLVCTIEMLNKNKGRKNRLVRKISCLLLTKAPVDQFICWSYFYKNQLVNWGIDKNKVIIVPPGINLKKYYSQVSGKKIKQQYSPNNPLLVFAKPLYLHHLGAVKLILKSIAEVKPRIKIHLLAGQGPAKKQTVVLAKKLHIFSQLKFMPHVSFNKIPCYLAAADLIVLPFTYAPTVSRSLLEALASGKPVITSNKGEVKFMLKDKQQAILVKNQPQKIAQAILMLLKNPGLGRKLSLNAVYLIKNSFSLNQTVKKTVSVYQQILNHG
jgi:glycosyltransferase involved in cell wall biosynthesis